jgi:hypothetical protein
VDGGGSVKISKMSRLGLQNEDLTQLAPGAPLYLETSAGRYSIQETHDGGLQITSDNLAMAILPQVTNRVTIQPQQNV